MRKAIRRGDLFYADLNPVVGSEQGGIRPVLVIQNDVGNYFSPTVVAASITSRKAKNSLPIANTKSRPLDSRVCFLYARFIYKTKRLIAPQHNCYPHMEKRGSRYLRYALYNATKYVCHWDPTFATYLATIL